MAAIPVEERLCACCKGPWQFVIYYDVDVGSFRPGFEPVMCQPCHERSLLMSPAEKKALYREYPLEENPTLASVMGADRMEMKLKINA